jgi:prepilin-type N-terminal cleavage/methylation domain-containing protein
MTRRGMTLIEMMVAMTAALLIMGAIAQVFSAFGSAISDSRSIVELDARIRSVAWKLRSDLSGATAPTLPPLSPSMDAGYFEIIEGPNTDTMTYVDVSGGRINPAFDKTGVAPGPTARSDDRIVGDSDDILLFTTRSSAAPFLGRFVTGTIAGKYESSVAEVAWFLRPTRIGATLATSNPTTFSLYRRQLLVAGYVGSGTFVLNQNMFSQPLATGTWNPFYRDFDLSVRGALQGSAMAYLPNTLADLTRRESRFMHNILGNTSGTGAGGFPFAVNAAAIQADPAPQGLTFEATTREGDDVVLSNVLAFDVRVFDPAATYTAATGQANGAYVDLGNGNTAVGLTPPGQTPRFAGYGAAASRLRAADQWAPRVYDTWSTHYESDGVDQDTASGLGVDQGTNGFDDNSNGVIDDGPADINGDGAFTPPNESGEMETSPPYPYPLRGIEVRIRCYEPSSRQVRQVTIRHTFVPY